MAGISITESSNIPEFEKDSYLDLLATDLKNRSEALSEKNRGA